MIHGVLVRPISSRFRVRTRFRMRVALERSVPEQNAHFAVFHRSRKIALRPRGFPETYIFKKKKSYSCHVSTLESNNAYVYESIMQPTVILSPEKPRPKKTTYAIQIDFILNVTDRSFQSKFVLCCSVRHNVRASTIVSKSDVYLYKSKIFESYLCHSTGTNEYLFVFFPAFFRCYS